MSHSDGNSQFERQLLRYVGEGVCEFEQHYRRVTYALDAALTRPLSVDNLMTMSEHLYATLLEIQAKWGVAPNDDYLCLLEMHQAVYAYAREIFTDVEFSPLEGDLSDSPEPDREMDHILTAVDRLVEGLKAVNM